MLQTIAAPVLPLFITALDTRFVPGISTSGGRAPAAHSWPGANVAIYMPITVPFAYPIARFFWYNGVGTAGNVDIGIYDASGNRIGSTGSTAQATTSVAQYVTLALTLPAGNYFLGMAASATASGQFISDANSVLQFERMRGMLQQSTAFPLPSSMTGVALAQLYVPLCGFTMLSSF